MCENMLANRINPIKENVIMGSRRFKRVIFEYDTETEKNKYVCEYSSKSNKDSLDCEMLDSHLLKSASSTMVKISELVDRAIKNESPAKLNNVHTEELAIFISISNKMFGFDNTNRSRQIEHSDEDNTTQYIYLDEDEEQIDDNLSHTDDPDDKSKDCEMNAVSKPRCEELIVDVESQKFEEIENYLNDDEAVSNVKKLSSIATLQDTDEYYIVTSVNSEFKKIDESRPCSYIRKFENISDINEEFLINNNNNNDDDDSIVVDSNSHQINAINCALLEENVNDTKLQNGSNSMKTYLKKDRQTHIHGKWTSSLDRISSSVLNQKFPPKSLISKVISKTGTYEKDENNSFKPKRTKICKAVENPEFGISTNVQLLTPNQSSMNVPEQQSQGQSLQPARNLMNAKPMELLPTNVDDSISVSKSTDISIDVKPSRVQKPNPYPQDISNIIMSPKNMVEGNKSPTILTPRVVSNVRKRSQKQQIRIFKQRNGVYNVTGLRFSM